MANPVAFENTKDIKGQARNNRGRIAGKGDELFQQDQDRAAEEQRRRDHYTNTLDEQYAGDAEGWGGYNDQEREDIMGSKGLAGLAQTGDEHAANYLTGDEEAGIRGDTDSQGRFFDPNALNQALEQQQGHQGQAVDDLDQKLRGAVDPDRLRQSETYRGNSRNILDRNRGGFDTTLDAVGHNVRGAIDPSAVTTSQEFLDDYNMSPEEQQDIVTGAGISAGTGYRAAAGELQRRAAASGASPMGVAAYRARMEREGAGAAGDAMTQARIRASEAAAGRKLTGEELRTQGGRYLTDTRTGTELHMGDAALAGERALGEQALGQENVMEQNRQGAEQYLTGANLDVAKTGGGAALQNAQLQTQQGQQGRQFSATTGTGLAQGQDRDASGRALTLGTNRQGAEQYNQDQRYGRGMAANNATSGRATTVGNARLGQQNTARNYYTGQADAANTNAQNAFSRQQQTYGTQTSGTNSATQTGLQADLKPGLFDKITGTAIGALGALGGGSGIRNLVSGGSGATPKADGGIVTQPTIALVGEDGPEQITPIGYRATAKVRPSAIPQPLQRKFYGEAA